MKYEDTAEALAEDQNFAADLEKNWALGEATDLCKREEANYKDLAKSESAAKKLISNRMSKFYNPKLYKAPPKRQLSEGDQIFENQGGDIPTQERATLSGAIESKMTRVDELGVEIAKALADVADLEKNCAEKSGIHDLEKAEQGDNYDKAIPSAAALRVEEWARGRQVSRAWRSLCDNMVTRLDTLHEAEATSYMQEFFG